MAHNALPRRPWRCISVVLSIILQTLGSFAMRSRKSMCVRRPLRLRPVLYQKKEPPRDAPAGVLKPNLYLKEEEKF